MQDPQAIKILVEIRKAPNEGLSRNDIHRNFRGMPHGQLDQLLTALSEVGVIYCRIEKHGGGAGRPAERWFPTL